MDYVLFLLLTATLFIRPAELVPSLRGWPIYEWMIIASLIVASPNIFRRLRPAELRYSPITVCVLGLFVAVPLSFLPQLSLWYMRWSATEFAKVVLFYLLAVGVLTSYRRVERLLLALLLFVSVLATLSLSHDQGLITLPTLKASMVQQVVDAQSGDAVTLNRLQSTGIFADPNDFAMILVVGIVFCLHFWGERPRFVWRGPLFGIALLLSTALLMTKSRGGVLALLGCLARWPMPVGDGGKPRLEWRPVFP